MTVFNFPDTGGQPTDGSFVWTAPNGTLYVWDGVAWKTTGGGSSGGGGNADITVTDDLTTISNPGQGDLAYHTEEARMYIYYEDTDSKQWVDASPGGDSIDDSGGGSSQYWDRLGTTLTPKVSGDDVNIGTGDFTANKGTFAGTVNTGDSQPWTSPSTLSGSQLAEGYLLNYRSVTDDSGAFIASYNGNGGAPVFQVKTDGSAEFAGTVNADDALDVTNSTTNVNSFIQRWFSDIGGTGTQKAIMMTTGQLKLQGDGSQGSVRSEPTSATGGYKAFYAKSASAGVSTQHFLYGEDSDGTNTARIATDGSSQFLGQVQISTASVGGLSEKVLLHEQGWIRAYNATSDASANMYLAYSDVNGAGTVGFFVTANGVVSARSKDISQIGSERRLKNTIESLDPVTSWETIRDLPYYSYKLNGNDDTTYYGPIVDECPEEMVVEGTTSYEEGNIRTYDNSLLQGRLFVALQTALTRIEALEAEVQALKGGN